MGLYSDALQICHFIKKVWEQAVNNFVADLLQHGSYKVEIQ